jgi:hypothetical protein
MARKVLFSIPESNPTIHTFRRQHELGDIEISPTWVNSKTLQVKVPLSQVNQDPWGEQVSLSAQCGDDHLLQIEDQGGDAFTISLPNISDLRLTVGTSGSSRDWVVNEPFFIEQGEDDSRGHLTYRIHSHESKLYVFQIINQTCGYEITTRTNLSLSPQTTIIELLTRDQWLSIDETSTLTLKIFQPNQSDPFHIETATVEPAPISEYSPSIDEQIGRFSVGRQTMEIHLKDLHPSQCSSSAEFNWAGGEVEIVNIIDGVLALPVPLLKSEKQGFLVIPGQNTRIVVEPYSACSEDTCTLVQTRTDVEFSSDLAEEPFLTVNHTGDWVGNLCVELVAKDNQPTASDVLMSQSVPLLRNGQTIEMSLGWLLEHIPGFKSYVLDASFDATFELNIHLFCGQDEEDRSEKISTQLFQPASIVKINEALYFDEGRDEPESVVFIYDQFYIEADEEFTFVIPGHEFVGTARGGEIAFDIYHPTIDQMDDNSVWKLIKHGQELLSGPYFVWPIEVHPPEKEATILVDPEFSSIAYPNSLFILQSLPLPSSFDIKLHIQIGSDNPVFIVRRFARGSAGGSSDFKQSVSLLELLGDDLETRNHSWLMKCREYGPGKIGEYWVEFPTRSLGAKMPFPLHVEIDIDASYLTALQYLKHQAASFDMKSVTQFFQMDLEHRDVVKDIIFTVLGHVYYDTSGKQRIFNQALNHYAGKSGFHAHTQEFRLRMKDPFSFFFGLFGEEVKTGSTEGLEFMKDASLYYGRPTNKSKDDLEKLWEVVRNE